MNQNDLAQFPSLARGYAALANAPQLAECFMSQIYPAHLQGLSEIAPIEAALARLLRRFSLIDLSEQFRNVFGTEEREWHAAMTEVLTFDWLERNGILECVGWPRVDGGTDTHHFEGRLLDARGDNQPIAFDVKNAADVGLAFLRDQLEPIAAEWSARHGLGELDLEFDYQGPTTREVLGPAVRALQESFRISLESLTALPNAPISLASGGTVVHVKVAPASAIRTDSGTTRLDARSQSVGNFVRRHILRKARHNAEFITIYVRPPGRGNADVSPRSLQLALSALETDHTLMASPGVDRWLGTVMFDWTVDPTNSRRYAHFIGSARWPGRSTPETLSASLQISRWP